MLFVKSHGFCKTKEGLEVWCNIEWQAPGVILDLRDSTDAPLDVVSVHTVYDTVSCK